MRFCYQLSIPFTVLTPGILLLPVWPLPRSLATTSGISVDFFSSSYLDVSVQTVPCIYLFIQYMLTDSSSAGLPHSDIHGSKPAFGSPWLFADRCVLRRLLVPRHSPYALCSLTKLCSNLFFGSSCFGLFLDDNFNIVVFTLKYLFSYHFTFALFSFQGAMVGSSGLEPPTSRLSGVRSNHLSYEPVNGFIRSGTERWWR